MSKIVCKAICACGAFTSFVDFKYTPTLAHARSRRHQEYLARLAAKAPPRPSGGETAPDSQPAEKG
jgi:hypothetical protein